MPFHGSASSASVVATWWPTRSVGLRPSEVATAPNSPPSISVALVKTTVLSVSSLSRIGPHTCRGATWSRAGKRSRASPSQSTSAWEPAAIRSALTKTSCTMPLAWVRPASPSPSPPDSRGNADRHPRAASRTSTRASESWTDTWSMRLGGVLEVAGRVAVTVGPAHRATGGPLDVGHPELVGRRLGDARGQLVGLVDDDRVVVGDHRHVLDRVDREEGVVGDDQVAAVRLLARELGEALRPERALARAEALAVVDRHLPPLAVGVA